MTKEVFQLLLDEGWLKLANGASNTDNEMAIFFEQSMQNTYTYTLEFANALENEMPQYVEGWSNLFMRDYKTEILNNLEHICIDDEQKLIYLRNEHSKVAGGLKDIFEFIEPYYQNNYSTLAVRVLFDEIIYLGDFSKIIKDYFSYTVDSEGIRHNDSFVWFSNFIYYNTNVTNFQNLTKEKIQEYHSKGHWYSENVAGYLIQKRKKVLDNYMSYKKTLILKELINELKEKTTDKTLIETIEPSGKNITANKTIALLVDLGVVDFILDKYCTSDNNRPNYSKAGKIICSFTGINHDTIRKSISDIPGEGKNSPLKNIDNVDYVAAMKKELKIE